jgi:hypothetical protein
MEIHTCLVLLIFIINYFSKSYYIILEELITLFYVADDEGMAELGI